MKFYPTLNETLAKRFEPGTEDGLSEIRDIVNHGIEGGFGGFIYNYELADFFNEFEREIEDSMYDAFGDGWLVDIANRSQNMQDMINIVVWNVVEMWCHHVVDVIDDTVDQECDLSVVA